MPSLPLLTMDNEPAGEVTLSERVFGARPNDHLLWEAARQAMASRRSGTHKTKTRAEVSGAGRKLWRQKGTGRARVGSIRTPLWRHGGTVHGPQPRDYGYRIPKKAMAGAMRSALSQKCKEGDLLILAELSLEKGRTQEVARIVKRLAIEGSGILVTAERDTMLELATRNLARVTAANAGNLTAFDVLASDKVILTQDAARKLEEAYAK